MAKSSGDGTKHTPYFECLEALQAGHCPVCHLAKKTVARQLDSLIYESVNDPGVRGRTAAAQGFCRVHAWQLRRQGGALGVAIIYRDVVRDVVEALDAAEYGESPKLSLRSLIEAVDRDRPSSATGATVRELSPTAECPACRGQQRAEHMYADVLIESVDEPEMHAALTENPGLCLPHLRLALERVRDERRFRLLVLASRNAFARLLDDLDEMIRRHDYRFTGGLAEFGDAWIRAITRVTGEEGLSEEWNADSR